MHKIVADKNGGNHIDLSLEEETKIKAEWAKNKEAQIAEEKKAAEDKALEEKAINSLLANVSKEDKDVLKKILGASKK